MRTLNRLLALLTDDDYALLEPSLEIVGLPQGMILSEPGEIDGLCYFPFSGICSTVATSPSGHQAEIGLTGREGMTPASLILGADSNPYQIVMQVGGRGAAIDAQKLTTFADTRPALRRILLKWANVTALQAAHTAFSNANHKIDERLGGWILMCHDRIDSADLPLTHEFLSVMLAVRRPSVTAALHVMEGKKLIYAKRGTIVIRDRKGLELFAGEAYGLSEREYDRLLGAARRDQ